jgi:import inner membrane translocase subunit TIM8
MSSASDEAAQRELQQFIQIEEQKARFQQQIHQFTDMCWDKCIAKIGNKLDRNDENCLGNCVERFLDTGMVLVKRLEQYSNQ